jgi:Rnl2 family RNA ligase
MAASDQVPHLPFKKYGSIKNADSYDGRRVLEVYGDLESVAMEKAHGAHFSLQTDGKTVESAKRRSVLTDEDKFHNFRDFMSLYSAQILDIFAEITEMLEGVTSIQVDGEFIGGSYAHPDVERIKGYARVQKGVFYAPDYKFFAYDIHCFRADETSFYVDYDVAEMIFKKVGLLYAEPMARGTFAELCALSNVFATTIPKKLGHPAIDENVAEGLVIKPVVNVCLSTGSRVILKSKNEKFSETQKVKDTTKSKDNSIRPEIAACIDSMVTANRLDNVISKFGEISMSDFGDMMKEMNLDVLDDFPQEYEEIYTSIDEEEWPAVKKYLNRKCSALIRKYFATH